MYFGFSVSKKVLFEWGVQKYSVSSVGGGGGGEEQSVRL